MKVIDTKFKGLKIILQKKNGDNRGYLRETYRKKVLKWEPKTSFNDLITSMVESDLEFVSKYKY